MNTAPLSPISALLAHVEPLLSQGRILVIGKANSSLGQHLLERGARLVQVFDPDAKRVAQAAAHNAERRITFAQFTQSSLRDGSFDVAIVEDLSEAADPEGLISGLRRSLSSRGVAICCCRNSEESSGLLNCEPGGLSYDEFSELLWSRFEQVTLHCQSPFLGYSIVQLGLDAPPEPTLDNAYLAGEGEPADYYIALCAAEDVNLETEDMTIVQLPAARLLADSENAHREREKRAARRVHGLEEELAELRMRVGDSAVERLNRELEQRDTWIRELEERAESADARADDAQAEAEELEQELEDTHSVLLNTRQDADRAVSERDSAVAEVDGLKKRLKGLEAALREAELAAQEAEHQSAGRQALEDEITELDELARKYKDTVAQQSLSIERLEKRLAAQDAELDELHKQLDETEDFLRDAEEESRLWESKAQNQSVLKDVEQDMRALEQQLKERGKRIIELESQLRKLESYARTLKVDTSDFEDQDGTAQELDQLARTLAEREADLVAAQWTIGQLQRGNKN